MSWRNTLPPQGGTNFAFPSIPETSGTQDADHGLDADFNLGPNLDPNLDLDPDQQQNNQPELHAGADNQQQFQQHAGPPSSEPPDPNRHANPFAFEDIFGQQPQRNQQTGSSASGYPGLNQPQDETLEPYGGLGGFCQQPPAGPQASKFGVPPSYHPLDPNFANLTYRPGSKKSNFGLTQQERQQQQAGAILSLSQAERESMGIASTQQARPHGPTQSLIPNAFSNWTLNELSSMGINSASQPRPRTPIASSGFQDYQTIKDTEVAARREAREQAEQPGRTLPSQPLKRRASPIDISQVPKPKRGRPLGSTKTATERDADRKKREVRNRKAGIDPSGTGLAGTHISRLSGQTLAAFGPLNREPVSPELTRFWEELPDDLRTTEYWQQIRKYDQARNDMTPQIWINAMMERLRTGADPSALLGWRNISPEWREWLFTNGHCFSRTALMDKTLWLHMVNHLLVCSPSQWLDHIQKRLRLRSDVPLTNFTPSKVPESQSGNGAEASLPPRSNQADFNPSKKRPQSDDDDDSEGDGDDKDGNQGGDEIDIWANREPCRCAPCDKAKKRCSYATKNFPCDRCIAKEQEHLCVSSKTGVPRPDRPFKVRKIDERLIGVPPKKTKTGKVKVKACDNCKRAKAQGNCDNGRPCKRCIRKELRDTCDASIQNQTYMGHPPVNPMASSSPVASSSILGRSWGRPQSNARASAAPSTSVHYRQHRNLPALYRAREGLPASLDPNLPDDDRNSDEIVTRLENQDHNMGQLHDPDYQPILTIGDTRSYIDSRNESFARQFANMDNRFSRNAEVIRNTIQQPHLQPESQLQQPNHRHSEGLSALATAPNPEQHHPQRIIDDSRNYDLEGRYEQKPNWNRQGQNTSASRLPQSARRHQQLEPTQGQLQQRRVHSVQEQMEEDRRWQEDKDRLSEAVLRQAARPAQKTARGFGGFMGFDYRPAAEQIQSLTSARQQAHQDRLQTAEQEARNASEANALRQTDNFDPVDRPLFDEVNGLLFDLDDGQFLGEFHERNRVQSMSSRGTTSAQNPSTNPLNFENKGVDDGTGEVSLFMDDPDDLMGFDELEPEPSGTS